MKFQLTKKNVLIAFTVFGLVALTIVIIILLKPSKNPDGCGSGWLCQKPGPLYNICLDDDFCSYSGLTNNNADCNCKAVCPDGQKSFPPYVNMKKDTNTTKWIPDGDKPVCGIPCSQAKSSESQVHGAKQGAGYCAAVPDQYCGVGNIYVQGQTENVYTGCFPKDKWTQCSNSLCLTPTDSSNPCTTAGICKITDYCGKNNKSGADSTNLYQACQLPSDCHDMYGNQGICNFKNSILTDKNITKVGYCQPDPAKPGQTLYFTPASDNSYCTTLDKIGNDAANNLVVCTGKKHSDPLYGRGVDGSIQCKDTAPAKGCAPDGICLTNKWQAYFDSSKDVTNCLTNEIYDSTKTPLCCSKERTIVSSDGNWCCPVTNTDCSNTTANPYSANMLSIPSATYTDSIDCTVTDNGDTCTDHNPDLIKSLTVDGFTPSSTVGDANFATLFCDTSIDPSTNKPINKCKAKCGYVDAKQHIIPDYVVTNDGDTDPAKPISFCTPKNHKCDLLIPQDWGNIPSPVNNIPICYNSDFSPTGKSTDKFYWSAPDNKGTTYQTQFSRELTGSNCSTPNMCAKLGSNINGIYRVEPDKTSCKFTVNCSNNNFMMQPSGMNSMKWSDGLTGLQDTNWTTCSDGRICPNKTKSGAVKNTPCSSCSPEAMWNPIAQSIPYTLDSSTQTCSGVINKIPKKLTVPLQPYDHETGQCHGNVSLESQTHLNTTGEYCPNGVVPETNQCYNPER